jgi:hypothetical protein
MNRALIILGLILFGFVSEAFPPPYYYNRFNTMSDTNLVNGNTLTNVQATSLQAIAASGILTNGNGKVDFDGINIFSDGAGNLTAISFTGNGGQLTGLSSAQLVGIIPLALLGTAVETNFDTRNWTNQSVGGIYANQFTGPLAGNVTGSVNGNSTTATLATNLLSPIGPVYYVATNGVLATALPNSINNPYPPVFSDATGTNFPNQGQAVDLASNGATICILAGSFVFTNIQLHSGVTLTGLGANFTRLVPTNTTSGYGPGFTLQSGYSWIQPGNNCTIRNLNLDASVYTNGPASAQAYGSWFLGSSVNAFTNLQVIGNQIYGGWDTLYDGAFTGNPSNQFTAIFENNVFHSQWDFASLSGYFLITFKNNDFYENPILTANASRLLMGGFGHTTLIGNRFWNFNRSGADNIIGGNLTFGGDVFINHGTHMPWPQLTQSYLIGGSIYDEDNGITITFSGAMPQWYGATTNFVVVTNYDYTKIQVQESGGGGGGFGANSEYQITNLAPIVNWENGFAVWTNGATGTAARVMILNDPAFTNDFGIPIMELESNSIALRSAWYLGGLTSSSTTAGQFAQDLWNNAPQWSANIGGGTVTVYPYTNSVQTNIASINYFPSIFGGSVYSNGTAIVVNGPLIANGAGITNNVGIAGILTSNIPAAITGTNCIHYSVPAGVTNTYSVFGFLNVTALATDVIQPKVIFTDEKGVVQTLSLGSSISSTGFNSIPYTTIRAKGGTVVDVTNTLTTGIGSITYDVEERLAASSGSQ